ncbi:MAG: hypothetical protein QGG96_04125 [Candidatus Poseidoniaceae archaeon]|nr:hypothetical protein [Candidatus Poseidoniaceae archaeon]
MAEVHQTTIEWNGPVANGQMYADLVPKGIVTKLETNGDLASLSLTITADSMDELRALVDEILTLFSDAEDGH